LILLNRTAIDDKIVERLLLKAAKAIGARTEGAVARISSGSRGGAGRAWNVSFIGDRTTGKRYQTPDGFIEISVGVKGDPLKAAEEFFETARHEFGHLRDFQTPGFYSRPDSDRLKKNGKRPAWGTRPEEIRAENYVYDADKKKRGAAWAYEQILAVAIAIEENQKRKATKGGKS
jgi:hypothetical protein